jgi:diguanylate cyclase (GGDEF)-like protein/PAS domain S-box-containing protein
MAQLQADATAPGLSAGRLLDGPISGEELVLGRIRARRHEAIDQLIPAMMLANIACAGTLTLLLWQVQPIILFTWCALIVALSAARLMMALRTNARTLRTSASPRSDRKRIRQAALMAVLFVSVPAWLLTQTSGAQVTCVICFLTGMLWAGGLILAPVLPSAATYVGLVSALTIAGLLASGCDAYILYVAFLFVAGGVTVLGTAKRQSELFTASQRQQIELEEQGATIGLLLKDYEDQTSDWLWETDADLRYQNPSERFAQALGRPGDAIQGVALGQLLVDDGSPENTAARRMLRDSAVARTAFRDIVVPFNIAGAQRWWALSGRPLYGGQGSFLGYRGVCADITPAKQAEARIAYLAHHDALTELPNRTLFCDGLDQTLQRGATRAAVLSLDLDGFKGVNDRYGHPAGDALLVAVAQRLRAVVEGGDQIARFGGDEFVILDTTYTDQADVEALAQHIIRALSAPFLIAGDDVTVGVSIGIAFAPTDGETASALIKSADAALYRAKGDGRGTFRFFEPEMDRRLQERQRLVQDLRSAIAHDELVLHYQPYVSAGTGVVSGCEALLRWQHPERGMISPAEFIPVAEQSGLIIPIGVWVLEEACRAAMRWPAEQRVSVNISPVQFRNRELPRTILTALTRAGLSPSRLEIEVTETVLIDDVEAALDTLRQIRALGVRVALDDFGTGYSSLSYLRSFPFDKVKIDRSFVQELPTRRDNQVIVQAIRDMARGLGMSVTAEGVETCEQAERLRATGCEELQGYLYSRPKPAGDLEFAYSLAPKPAAKVKVG